MKPFVYAALVLGLTFMAIQAFAAEELTSIYVETGPTIDGVVDDLWNNAPEVTLTAAGGANNPSTDISIRSVHTKDRVFLLFQWTDPTESLERFPWVKQDDGTWKKMVSPDNAGGDENTYYEDKLAMIWNINDSIAGFNETGCFVTCHAGEAGKPFGNKYTMNPGEIGDIWHWKGVRTNPVGYADDQYVDDTRYNADTAPEAGRHSDPKESGGYVNNVNEAGDGPAFMSPNGPAPPYWILDDEKVPFEDTFQPGDAIPGIIVKRPVGDRGDIDAKGVYADGKWTLELGRDRETGSPFDIQLTEDQHPYYFGVAVFDNAQVRHSWANTPVALTLEGTETAVDPAGKLLTTWSRIKSSY